MLMDPISGFGIAANVISFVSVGSKIFSTARDVYQHGRTDEHRDFQIIKQDLEEVKESLEKDLQSKIDSSGIRHEASLQQLARRSQEICEQVSKLLNGINTKDRKSRWNAFRTAVKAVWSEEDIVAFERRLNNISQELIVSLLLSFRSARATIP